MLRRRLEELGANTGVGTPPARINERFYAKKNWYSITNGMPLTAEATYLSFRAFLYTLEHINVSMFVRSCRDPFKVSRDITRSLALYLSPLPRFGPLGQPENHSPCRTEPGLNAHFSQLIPVSCASREQTHTFSSISSNTRCRVGLKLAVITLPCETPKYLWFPSRRILSHLFLSLIVTEPSYKQVKFGVRPLLWFGLKPGRGTTPFHVAPLVEVSPRHRPMVRHTSTDPKLILVKRGGAPCRTLRRLRRSDINSLHVTTFQGALEKKSSLPTLANHESSQPLQILNTTASFSQQTEPHVE